MDPEAWLPNITLGAGLIAVFALFAWYLLEPIRRRARWAALAAALGCRYTPRDPFGITDAQPHALLGEGDRHRAVNVLHGRYRSRTVLCFECEITTEIGQYSGTRTFTALLIDPPCWFEPMLIRPEGLSDRLAWATGSGFRDIQFESEEFNRRFWVGCADRRFAYDVVHARTMRFLLAEEDLEVHAAPESVLFVRGGGGLLASGARLLRVPEGVRDLIDRGCDFMDLLPEHLLRERERAPE